MIKFKCFLAYVLSFVCFFLGILVAIIWTYLYSPNYPTNVIDISQLLAEQITPGILSVYFAKTCFDYIYPNINSKFLNKIISYSLMLIFFATTIPTNLTSGSYSNFIYTITGIITTISFMLSDIKKYKLKEININERI